MPAALVFLAILALVLYVLWAYLLPSPPATPPYSRVLISWVVVLVVWILWRYSPMLH